MRWARVVPGGTWLSGGFVTDLQPVSARPNTQAQNDGLFWLLRACLSRRNASRISQFGSIGCYERLVVRLRAVSGGDERARILFVWLQHLQRLLAWCLCREKVALAIVAGGTSGCRGSWPGNASVM
jgi:hypothetical protein